MLLLEQNIPEFIQCSPYLQSLHNNGPFPEEGLEIPDGCAKKDLTVNSKDDLIELLQTIRFWLVPEVAEISSDLLAFALLPASPNEFVEIAAEFQKDIPFVDEIVQVKNSCENGQIEVAAGLGRLCILQFLCENVGLEPTSVAGCAAAKEGHLKCLEYLHLRGVKLTEDTLKDAVSGGCWECATYVVDNNDSSDQTYIPSYFWYTAYYGRLEWLQMLTEWALVVESCSSIIDGAVEGNQLEVLQFATDIKHDEETVRSVMRICARNGYVECLEHLHNLGYGLQDGWFMENAVENGHLNCVQFLVEHNYSGSDDMCTFAAEYDELECLEYAHEHGMPWNEYTCAVAAEYGHLACLQYAHEHGCPWWDRPAVAYLPRNDRNKHCRIQIKVATDITSVQPMSDEYDEAGSYGIFDPELIAARACQAPTIDCLLYVLKQGAALSPLCAYLAALSGSLTTLKFLHKLGFTWEACACEMTATRPSLKFLRFLRDIGTPWNARTTRAAAKAETLQILQYAHEHGCPWHEDVCLEAARAGKLRNLQYAHEHGAPWTSEVCRYSCTQECYDYAVTHGCPVAEREKSCIIS